jgi:hypothetical protein
VSTTSITAGWLVLAFSLLSNASEVDEGLAWISRPLFGAPFSHACTWPVMGIETNAPAVEIPIGPATKLPGSGPPGSPLTVPSDQADVAVYTFTDPAAPTLFT